MGAKSVQETQKDGCLMGIDIDLYEFSERIVGHAEEEDLDTIFKIGHAKTALVVDVGDMPPQWKERLKELKPDYDDDSTVMVVVQ
jgi:hypothetical protein